mmetsp:Transcript_19594/g.30172  ORF Transcript_19594/g.30172 Transcript_19594/m.30172 type:complete len:121 (+) Transcript_19594:289-651(+)
MALAKPKKMLSLEDYVQSAQSKASEYETIAEMAKEVDPTDVDFNKSQMGQSRKAYYRELKKVIEESDVLIEVLDARDPEGCRSTEIEQEVLKQNKKLLLVLNKIDLVPPQNARMWQKYLR